VVTAETAALDVPMASPSAPEQFRVLAGWLWSAALLVVLTFLVLYPVAMLLLARSPTPIRWWMGSACSICRSRIFSRSWQSQCASCVHHTLVACAGGTALAVAIGLTFSWIVVRTNTPWRRFIGGASLLPLFVPPLVAGVAWSILGSPSPASSYHAEVAGLDWRIDL